MKPIHYAALALLGAVWGASFLFIGVAVPEFGPLMLMFARVLIAGLIMLGVAYWTQRRNDWRAVLRLRDNWRKYLIVGLLNAALPFTLIAYAELRLPVSLAAILISTTPLFTALIAAAGGDEALTGRKIASVLMGVVGVAVLVGGAPVAAGPAVLLAVVASLLAALCYSLAAVYAARHFGGLPAAYASAVQLLAAALWLAVPGMLAVPGGRPSTTALGALAALILLSTTFAYVIYFYLLKRIGPTRTASVTFLVPVFASLWAVLFLREPFTPGMLVGMGIILFSVGLVMKRGTKSDELRVTSDK